MKLRVVVSLLGFASLLGVSAQAQERKTIDVFAGYSYVRANPATSNSDGISLNGGSASIAYNVNNWLSGVADLGGYHSTNILGSRVDGTLSTYLFGPRVSYHHFGRVTPFGEVLFGVAHTSASLLNTTDTQNAFAMTVGGGFQVKVNHKLSLRLVQAEYLYTRFGNNCALAVCNNNNNQNSFRLKSGIVINWGGSSSN